MADSRFFNRAAPIALAQLAEATGSTVENGDASKTYADIAPLDTATANDLSFFDNTKYLDAFVTSNAGACFVRSKFASRAPKGMALLVNEEPYTAFAIASGIFYPTSQPAAASIHPTAVIAKSAMLGKDVSVAPYAIIGEHVKIGAGSSIGAHAVIYENVEIGSDTAIGAHSTISHSLIGNHVTIHRGVHIGQDGFGFAPSPKGILKVPQLGRVIIEDHADIGSGTCIDRGAGPDTVIGAHSKIDNLVQIGHNVKLGRYVLIAAQTGISGSCKVEDGAMLGGQVGLSGHLTVGKGAKLAAQSGVMSDVPAGETHMGYPAMPMKAFFRQVATLKKLSERKE